MKVENNKGRFSLNQVAEILLVKDARTIKDYAEKGLIPRIELDNDSLTISAQELAEALKVTDFNEKFIDAKAAQKILAFSTPLAEKICIKKGIPFFYLGKNSQHGRKLLFKESLLCSWLKKTQVTLNADIHWIENLQKERILYQMMPILEVLAKNTEFAGGRTNDITMSYFKGESLQEIADKVGVSSSRIGQLLEKMNSKIIDTTKRLSEWFSNLNQEEYELVLDSQKLLNELKMTRESHTRLQAELHQAQNLIQKNGLRFDFDSNNVINEDARLSVNISELDFSVRLYNGLNSSGIRTLGEILKFSKNELLGLRNFGNKSLTELENFLSSIGYELQKR